MGRLEFSVMRTGDSVKLSIIVIWGAAAAEMSHVMGLLGEFWD